MSEGKYTIELCAAGGPYNGVQGVIASDDNLTAARELYRQAAAENPGQLVILYASGRVLARSDEPDHHAGIVVGVADAGEGSVSRDRSYDESRPMPFALALHHPALRAARKSPVSLLARAGIASRIGGTGCAGNVVTETDRTGNRPPEVACRLRRQTQLLSSMLIQAGFSN